MAMPGLAPMPATVRGASAGSSRRRGRRPGRGFGRALRRRLLARAQARDRGADPGERSRLVVALRRDRHRVAAAQAELEERDQVLGVGDLGAGPDLDPGRAGPGHLDPVGGRPCVQAGRVIDGPVEALAQVARRAGGARRRRVLAERRGDVGFLRGGAQLLEARLVLDQAGEPAQHRDVGVGLRGDGHHEMRRLAVVPRDALGHLQHREPALADEVPVIDHAVRDHDAVAQIGVRHRLPGQHARAVGGLDAARRGEELGGLADRRLLGGGSRAEPHEQARAEGRRRCEHGVLSSRSNRRPFAGCCETH